MLSLHLAENQLGTKVGRVVWLLARLPLHLVVLVTF